MAGLFDFAQSASNAIAGNVGGPVDIISMAMRAVGMPIPEAPIGSTEWMRRNGLVRDVEQGPARVLGETAGLLGPAMAAKFAPQIAGGLLQAGDNLSAPATLNRQTGAVYIPGGGMSNSIDDAYELAEKIKSLGPQYSPKIEQAKGGSVYLTVDKVPLTKAGTPAKNKSAAPTKFKARFADHPSYWGASVSSDPLTGNTVEDAFLAFLRDVDGQAPQVGEKFTEARFVPGLNRGEITEKVFSNATSLRGNPVQKWVGETRPFTFLDDF